MNLVKVEVSEGSYILPPQVLDINLVKIMSNINKPLDRLTIRDICTWHENTEKYVEFSIKLPDQYTRTIEYESGGAGFRKTFIEDKKPIVKPFDPNKHNPLGIQVGDKISSDSVRSGAILKCMQLIDNEEKVTWEDFTGHSGCDKTVLFKKYVPGIDKFVKVDTIYEAIEPSSTSMGYIVTDTGYLLVNVGDNVFKKGDYVSKNIYIKEIFQYVNHYGLVLDIDMKCFTDMGYDFVKNASGSYITNVINEYYVPGLLVRPNIIIDKVFKDTIGSSTMCRVRIYEKKFMVNSIISKHTDKNYYDENNKCNQF